MKVIGDHPGGVGRNLCIFNMTMAQQRDRSALILYGSETGTARDFAEEIGSITERLHFLTHVSNFDVIEPVRVQ